MVERTPEYYMLQKKFDQAEKLIADSWQYLAEVRRVLDEQKQELPRIKNWPYYLVALKASDILDDVKDTVDIPQLISSSIDKLLSPFN